MKRPPIAPRKTNGFTLIECLLASVILAFSVTAGVYAVSAARQQEVFITEQEVALVLSNNLMQQVVATGYDGVDPAASADSFDGYGDAVTSEGDAAAPSATTYGRSVSVQTQAAAGLGLGGDLRVVTVTVTTPSGQTWQRRRLLAVQGELSTLTSPSGGEGEEGESEESQ